MTYSLPRAYAVFCGKVETSYSVYAYLIRAVGRHIAYNGYPP